MPLDIVNHRFQHPGGTSTIQRSFIDMPMIPKMLCLIRQVQVRLVELDRVRANFDVFFAVSVDPDHVLTSMVLLDSTIFLAGSHQILRSSAIGENIGISPDTFMYPEGIKCPYTKLPFFVQNSNTTALVTNWNLTILYELIKLTAQEEAIAVMRRGRGTGRRVPESP